MDLTPPVRILVSGHATCTLANEELFVVMPGRLVNTTQQSITVQLMLTLRCSNGDEINIGSMDSPMPSDVRARIAPEAAFVIGPEHPRYVSLGPAV